MIPDETPDQLIGPMGHNRPPEPIDTVTAEINDVIGKYRERALYLVERCEAKTVRDRLSAGEAGDIIKTVGDVEALLSTERMGITRPYREAADHGKQMVDVFWEPVEYAVSALRGRLQAWNNAEDEKIAQQQREQEEFLANLRQPPKPEPMPSQPRPDINYSDPAPRPAPSSPPMRPAHRRKVKGDLGSISGNVDVASYKIIDITQVPTFIMNSPMVHDAVISVIKSMAKHLGDIPGVEKTISSQLKVQ